jgi:hypothetical protein
MAIVQTIKIIRGSDREFDLLVRFNPSLEPKDLSALVGGSGDGLQLTLPGEDTDLVLTLDPTANASKLEVLTVASGLAGKIHVTLGDADTAALRVGDSQDMELRIKEGAGPDFDISKVQYLGKLNVKAMLFS